ncbi:RadC family protein [Halorhodospira halochloris]|uniref:RadC family protein n=1 Tax=Halorhodospira halochloris TaxID=1052 RepID=UPI001EE95EF3|nr:DNA repair protein RadC [Halorhodospira halochloris]MCG5547517.1 DNA repair protein RadC [Halorhodospira halochloris]
MIHAKLQTGEKNGTYVVSEPVTGDELLEIAQRIARRRLAKGRSLSCPSSAYQALQTQLLDRDYEVFGVVYLDTKHRILGVEELFRGTIDGATIHPREVLKEALRRQAAAVILVHNHPSGHLEPSVADERITERLRQALELIDVRLIDHIIVSAEGYTSLAERGSL